MEEVDSQTEGAEEACRTLDPYIAHKKVLVTRPPALVEVEVEVEVAVELLPLFDRLRNCDAGPQEFSSKPAGLLA